MPTRFEVLKMRTPRYLRKLEPEAEQIRKRNAGVIEPLFEEACLLTLVSVLQRVKRGEITESKSEELRKVLLACASPITDYTKVGYTALAILLVASSDWKPQWYNLVIF